MIALDIFRENIKKCWQFALDVAWDQNARHPELSRGKCLEERSYLHTLLDTNQAEVFLKARKMADEVTEKEQMNVLLPEVMQYVEEHKYPVTLDNPEFEPGRPFRYNLLQNNWCYIHIRNAKMPDSFLADAGYVAENLRYVMDKAEKEHNCDTIYTATWLNDAYPFLRFFPDEWQKNLADTMDFGPTLGWQGQFVNAQGLLNERAAARFLRTGVLPCARRESHCSFAALREHLKQMGL